MIYLSSADKFPLQLVLHTLLNASMQALTSADSGSLSSGEALDLMRQAKIAETMKYSMIFISSAPLLIAYPFVQKFFIKGMMIGALKG
jgi:ABC-type glycerol-3-phosphate transport system permease component